MPNIKDEIANILSESSETIKMKVVEELQKSIINGLTWNMRDEVTKIISDFIKDELKEDIKNILLESKENMVSEIQKGIVAICGELATTMAVKAEKNLKDSWATEDILKKLFR